MNRYLEMISVAVTEDELDEIVTRAADDEDISNPEYEFIYEMAMERAMR